MSDDLGPSLDFYVKAALGRKAFDIVILDVRDLTSIADAFIICSGRSHRQVAAIAEIIQVELKKHGIKHEYIHHPAARGKIRIIENYKAHVREQLENCLV